MEPGVGEDVAGFRVGTALPNDDLALCDSQGRRVMGFREEDLVL